MTLDSISAHEAILEEEEEQAQANGHGEIDQSPDIYYDAIQNFDDERSCRIYGADDFEFESEELGMEDEEEEGMQEENDGYEQGQEMSE